MKDWPMAEQIANFVILGVMAGLSAMNWNPEKNSPLAREMSKAVAAINRLVQNMKS